MFCFEEFYGSFVLIGDSAEKQHLIYRPYTKGHGGDLKNPSKVALHLL